MSGLGYPWAASPSTSDNFTIAANEEYWNNSINTFSALIDGTTWYHTTTGLINTTLLTNDTITHNITLNASGYLNQTYTNWNVTTDLVANLTRNYTILNISAFDYYGGNAAINTFTVSTNDSQVLSTTTGNLLMNFSWNQSILLAINASSFFNYTATANTSQHLTAVNAYMIRNYTVLNVTGWNIYNSKISVFTATAESLNSTHSATGSTTAGEVSLSLLWNETYNVTFDATNYSMDANTNKTVTMSVNFTRANFTNVYRLNAVNLTFRDEETGALVYNVTLEFISDVYAANFTTNPNATFYIDLLSPEIYTLRYSKAGYAERLYTFNLQNRTYTELTLYLLNASSATNVTATVYDEINNKLEGVYIKVLKYDLPTNTYLLQEIASTNFEGKTILHLVLNSEFYKFILEYPLGTVREETAASYIYSSTLAFQITLAETVATEFEQWKDVSHSLVFNTATNNFRLTYSDANNVASQACLEVFKITTSGITAYNSSCSSGAAGTILVGVAPINYTTYLAKSYIYFGSEEQFLGDLTYSFEEPAIAGKYGIFLIIILTTIFIFVGYWDRRIALILAPLPLFFGSILNVIDINIGYAIALLVLCVIIAIVISLKGR